jgi:hypothetical protein
MTMPVDVSRTIRQALSQLQSERDRLDRQIRTLQGALDGVGGGRGAGGGGGARRGRRRMSAEARRAVSQRMKAYWAARRAKKTRGKTAKNAS